MVDKPLRFSQFSHRKHRTLQRGLILALIIGLAFVWGAQNVRASITNPPANTIAFQTTGRLAPLQIADFYTQDPLTPHEPFTAGGGENTTHEVVINIPCNGDGYRIELFDPEVYDTGLPGDPSSTETLDDEARQVYPGWPPPPLGQDQGPDFPDRTRFELYTPGGGLIFAQNYGPYVQPANGGPPPPEHDNWVYFASITGGTNFGVDCGPYTMETWTGNGTAVVNDNNDDNAWAYRLLGGDNPALGIGVELFDSNLGPDGIPGSGDEAWIGVQRLSYQHSTLATQNFWWFVDYDEFGTGIDEWIGHNFDIDTGSVSQCGVGDANCSITYNAPTLGTFPATLSAPTVWNGGDSFTRGTGDPHTDALGNTEWGKWRADVRTQEDNQYIFEVQSPAAAPVPDGQKPIFLTDLELPDLNITKDDGVYEVANGDFLTYTIRIENTGNGAAMPIQTPEFPANLPEIRDTIPPGTTYVGCSVTPPLVEDPLNPCGETAPGVVDFQLVAQNPPTVLGYLPSPNSGLQSWGEVTVTVQVNTPAPPGPGTLLPNTSRVRWTDIYRNIYPPRDAEDIDVVGPADLFDLELQKSVSDSTAYIGQTVTYTIVLTNQGPEDAIGPGVGGSGIVVTDAYPDPPPPVNLTAPFNITITENPVNPNPLATYVYDPVADTLTLGQPLPVGSTVTLTYDVTVTGPMTDARNVAQVQTAAPIDIDSTPGNMPPGGIPSEDDEAEALISAAAVTDLELTVTVDNPSPNVGDTVNFTITFTHTPPLPGVGPVDAEIQLTLPPDMAFGPGSVTLPPGATSTYNPATGLWTINGLDEYTTATLVLPATLLVNASQTLTGEVISSSLTDIDADPNNHDPTEDDQDSATVTPPGSGGGGGVGGAGAGGGGAGPAVQTGAEAFTKHGAPDTAVVGETVTWTITINNTGGVATDPGAVTDSIPPQFDIVSATSSQGTVSASGNTVTANPGTINAGGTVTITIQTVVNNLGEPGEICNWATMLGFTTALPRLGPGGMLMAALQPVTWTAEDCIILFPDLLPATGGQPISDNWWLWLIWAAVIALIGVGLWRLRTTRQPIRVKSRRREER